MSAVCGAETKLGPYTYSDSHTYAYTDAYTDTDTDSDTDTYSDADTYSDTYTCLVVSRFAWLCALRMISVARKQCACVMAVSVRFSTSCTSCVP